MKKGRFNFSKSIKIAPFIRLRASLASGLTLVLGKGLTYSIPLGKPDLKKLLPSKEPWEKQNGIWPPPSSPEELEALLAPKETHAAEPADPEHDPEGDPGGA